MRRQPFVLTLGILLVFVAPASRAVLADTPTAYTITDLGTIYDPVAMTAVVPTITGVNAAGQISGFADLSAGRRAVRYDNGTGWHLLPGLENTFSAATGINATGDLSGYEFTSAGFLAFRYTDGAGVTTLGLLPGGNMAAGMAINDNGDVVGYGTTASGMSGWRAAGGSTTLTVLPMLPGGSSALTCGINKSGAIVGSATTSSGEQHAYRINTDGTTDDAGSFDGSGGSSAACAIDDNGRVGGNSSAAGSTHAFRFDTGTLVDVDSFSSSFSTVQSVSAGVSVGLYTTASGNNHAFVQNGTNAAVDLNTLLSGASGWVLSEALAVNANGAIAGDGLVNGVPADFLLTPVKGDTTPPVISSVTASPSSITHVNGATIGVTVTVNATDDSGVSPTCSLSTVTGPGIAGVDYGITGQFSGFVKAIGGRTYTFTAHCVDGSGNASESSVNVVVPADVLPPAISSVTASPSTIWPPKGQTVGVTIAVAATDDSGVVTCTLASITGPGTAGTDYQVTGPLSGNVKAVGGRTYSFNAICTDFSGNTSSASAAVVVPPDTTAPVITGISATPSTIWPPDNKMYAVTVSATATDDVDDSPVCSLTSISGASTDAAITGASSATVRASNGNIYVLTVTCSDFSGNRSTASTVVTITKQPASMLKPNGRAK